MSVTRKLFVTIFFIVTVALFSAYCMSIISSDDSFYGNSSGNEIVESNNANVNKKDSPKGWKEPLDDYIDLAGVNDSNDKSQLNKFSGSWSPYLDKNSAEYKYILDKYKASEVNVLIDEGNVYFVRKIDDEIELVKITKEYRDLVKYEPFNVYSVFLEQLNELEEYGDWSYGAEVIVRNIFSQYFKGGEYSISTMQCREKTCLIEFNFSDLNFANNFVDELRKNRKKCQCIPAETIWPELKQAVLKLDLI
ncbi:hypothetical protein A5320_08995 [Rheinheimera sp. SA_1]|uniref:hypothetical protein n=1 Tax=Rheinheimera sp. SA_1 TaxID=1827365 RepID=UPI0007FB733F|nr:hypothetical protein [Rheinheimera sp. SA_1]OBP15477.1 hypothetical protein A5320_08995 [Rheinheimera sp. SA_1]